MEKRKEVEVYWDIDSNVPVILENGSNIDLEKYSLIGKDLRPVFLQEKWLLLNLFPEKFNEELLYSSVWATKQNRYIIDGKQISDMSPSRRGKSIENMELFRIKVLSFVPTDEQLEKEQDIFDMFALKNSKRINYLTKNEGRDQENHYIGAYPFIQEVFQKNKERLSLVSFSGGKDSTVVSHLVRKALNNPSILHIFGDTTLELPKSYDYVERFKEDNDFTPFFEERNEENNFFEMCETIGPPSRVKSWCCSIFKTGPMGTTLANFDENILTFLGVRRQESVSRSKYEKVAQSPKILKQKVACPIIDWMDIDVWLYMLTEELDFNDSYRQGFARVGCWVCPNNGDWSQLLSSIYNWKEYDKWYEFLINFAKKIGKQDYEDYVRDGKWKARQGGDGLEKSEDILLTSKECINEKNSKTYILNKNINNDFLELFKPFGKLKIINNRQLLDVYIMGKDETPIFKILYKSEDNNIKVTIINSSDKYIFNRIEKQLNKFNSCMSCQGCNSACPTGAIDVSNNSYTIDSNLCIHCLKCIDKFDSGCLITSALKIKKR